MPPYLILALPRSRTRWCAGFLSYGDWLCSHDALQYMRSLEDVRTFFTQPNVGTAETAAAPYWRLIGQMAPDARIVTVRRPVPDVLASVMHAIPGCDRASMERMLVAADRKLDQIEARIPGVLSVRFADLADEATCREIFEFCLPYAHDPAWWRAWDETPVSGNLAAQVRYCRAYLPQLQKLARTAKHRILADMTPADGAPDGFTFQDEPFDRWYADAVPLFREHMAQTGQDIDDFRLKNTRLGQRLDDAGAAQIITARSNGRMFGYLVSVISPMLDHPTRLMAQHLPVFASPACPGLGMKLQRASIEALRRKGVSEVLARAGTRGSGPRLGTVYRRLGFEDAGHLYRLELT